MTPPVASPLRTSLYEWHRAHGARLEPADTWELAFEFAGAADEHLAVRKAAGLFDLGHLGQIEIAGRDALAVLQRATSNDASRLRTGQAQHSVVTTPVGGFVDDPTVYRLTANHFLLVVSAANTGKLFTWLTGQAGKSGDAAVVNTSARYALLALQGPAAAAVLREVTAVDVASLEAFEFTYGEVAGVRATVSRTGWAGEDGFEILAPPAQAPTIWQALLGAGQEDGVVPAGLDARDLLRLEAGVPVQGRDMDERTSVLEAGLERLVAWDKGEFNGRQALDAQRTAGPARRLVGFEMIDRAVACHGQQVLVGGTVAGAVTSAGEAPFLRKAIGLAYLPAGHAEPGSEFDVDVGGRRARARVVPLPFYNRSKG